MSPTTTFGQAISEARKKAGLSQRELAEKVTISAQYLNDIERDRRNPPTEEVLRALSKHLDLAFDYLLFLAGKLPDDLLKGQADEKRVVAAYHAFRKKLKGGEGDRGSR